MIHLMILPILIPLLTGALLLVLPSNERLKRSLSVLATLAKRAPKLAEDLSPKTLSLSVLVRVLQNLLVERVPIRQLRKIAEALVEHGAHTQDPAVLTAAVRNSLGRFIVQEIAGAAPEPDATRLTFLAYGDTRSNPGTHDQVARAMLSAIEADPARPSLVLVSGDLVSQGGTESA